MNVAIIPARGGSKRIPGKNIRLFAGKPIIAYSIETALKSGLFDKVIVSTDDDEIARAAMSFGAEIPFMRPAELSDDHTGTMAVINHAIRYLLGEGFDITRVCCIYATAPFVQVQYLQEGYNLLVNSDKAYSFSVTSFPFPIQRVVRITSDNTIEPFNKEHIFTRSQDLEEAFHDAGQFYWGTVDAFLKNVVMYSNDSVPVVLPRHLVQDIDTEEDWHRAELMYRAWMMDGDMIA
jgi:N-acylneuraminate cytidylyltransferase